MSFPAVDLVVILLLFPGLVVEHVLAVHDMRQVFEELVVLLLQLDVIEVVGILEVLQETLLLVDLSLDQVGVGQLTLGGVDLVTVQTGCPPSLSLLDCE